MPRGTDEIDAGGAPLAHRTRRPFATRRQVRSVLVIALLAILGGIAWDRLPRAYPDRRWDLHFLTADDIAAHRPPRVLPDYAGDAPPSEFQGQLYWIEHRPPAEEADAPGATQVMAAFAPGLGLRHGGGSLLSARRDGSDRRVVLAEGRDPGLTLLGLWVDRTRDRLYVSGVSGASAAARPGSDFARQRSFVARVATEGAGGALGARLTLPEGILGGPLALDDGWVYFSASIPRRGLGATLSDLFSRETTRTAPPALCRMTLPE